MSPEVFEFLARKLTYLEKEQEKRDISCNLYIQLKKFSLFVAVTTFNSPLVTPQFNEGEPAISVVLIFSTLLLPQLITSLYLRWMKVLPVTLIRQHPIAFAIALLLCLYRRY